MDKNIGLLSILFVIALMPLTVYFLGQRQTIDQHASILTPTITLSPTPTIALLSPTATISPTLTR